MLVILQLTSQTFDLVLSPLGHTGEPPPEDNSPSQEKVARDSNTGDFYIHQIDGIRLSVRWKHDNSGYDVATSELFLNTTSETSG